MLLIIFLGLIAKLMFVSGECGFGTQHMDDFDYTKFSGRRPWYLLWHTYNEMENDFDCPFFIFARPTGNRSSVTTYTHVISTQRNIRLGGYAVNWNGSGFFVNYPRSRMLSGTYRVLAVKYRRYFIAKHCPLDSNESFIYVGFRSIQPDDKTLLEVEKKLQDNDIDESQLVSLSTNYCLRNAVK